MTALPVDDRGDPGSHDTIGYRICGNMQYRVDLISLACVDDVDPGTAGQNQPSPVTRLASACGIKHGPVELYPSLVHCDHMRRALTKVTVVPV